VAIARIEGTEQALILRTGHLSVRLHTPSKQSDNSVGDRLATRQFEGFPFREKSSGTGHEASKHFEKTQRFEARFFLPVRRSRKLCKCYGKFTSVGEMRTRGLLYRTRLRAPMELG
jgi:hypothetical protein